jgi:ABC-type Fe3+-citrate transport system substrate-binding protein
MKAIAVAALTLAMSAFAIGGLVQRPTQDQTSQPQLQQPAPGMMQGMGGGMMGTMGQVGQMMNRHQQMMENMSKLMQSMAAIEAEKDPAALKAKLAEHRALLEQMHSQMMFQGQMMQQMMGYTQPPAASGSTQPPAAK